VTNDLERLAELERRIARLEEALRARNSREQKQAAEEMLLQVSEKTPHTAERAVPSRMVIPTPRSSDVIPGAMPRFADVLVKPTPKRDWEALIGRYGTLVLATTTALAGVGTFVGWAIANGLLGPAARVGLGLAAAAALAVWGLNLRQKERSFGASILGIALAIVHVCAWGAGPSLHLVPTSWAFALAAVASLALEMFAHRENDEALWSVGFFGAAIAPFVTSDGGGSLPLLTAYGVGVLVSGGFALGNRPWRIAGRLFHVSAALYVFALMLGREAAYGPMLAAVFPIAVGYLGVIRWSEGWKRRHRLRGLGIFAAIAAVRAGFSIGLPLTHLMHAQLIGLLGLAWLGLVALTHDAPETEDAPLAPERSAGDRMDAGLVPLAFAGATITALSAWPFGDGVALVIAAGALLVTHLKWPEGGLRDGAALAAVTCAAAGAALMTTETPTAMFSVVAAIGALSFAADRWKPSGWWTGAGLVGMAWSMIGALGLIGEREPYAYTPFLTSASATAAAIAVSMAAAWRLARDPDRRFLVAGGALAWAFIWVHQEIASAYSRTVSTVLRVSYYAASSVAAVALGRAKQVPVARHAGLALAVIAAGTALYSASELPSVGARVLADLVAAAFLLAIAFWYRTPGVKSTAQEENRT
jgi:hypothetical protein